MLIWQNCFLSVLYLNRKNIFLNQINNFKLDSWVRNFCNCQFYRRIISRVSDRIQMQVSSYTVSNFYIAIMQIKFQFKELEIFIWKKRLFRLLVRAVNRQSKTRARIPAQSETSLFHRKISISLNSNKWCWKNNFFYLKMAKNVIS